MGKDGFCGSKFDVFVSHPCLHHVRQLALEWSPECIVAEFGDEFGWKISQACPLLDNFTLCIHHELCDVELYQLGKDKEHLKKGLRYGVTLSVDNSARVKS